MAADGMVTMAVYISERHVKFVKANSINFSMLVRRLLDEEMKRRGAF